MRMPDMGGLFGLRLLGAGSTFSNLDHGHVGQGEDQQAPVFFVEGCVGGRGLDQVARVGGKGRGVGFDPKECPRGKLLAVFLTGEDLLVFFPGDLLGLVGHPQAGECDGKQKKQHHNHAGNQGNAVYRRFMCRSDCDFLPHHGDGL